MGRIVTWHAQRRESHIRRVASVGHATTAREHAALTPHFAVNTFHRETAIVMTSAEARAAARTIRSPAPTGTISRHVGVPVTEVGKTRPCFGPNRNSAMKDDGASQRRHRGQRCIPTEP